MNRFLAAARPLFVAGLSIAVAENLLTIGAYGLAFGGAIDRILFALTFICLQGLLWMAAGLLVAVLIWPLASWAPGAGMRQVGLVTAVATFVPIAAYLTPVARAFVRDRPGLLDWAVAAGLASLAALLPLALGFGIGRRIPASARGIARPAIAMAVIAVLGWTGMLFARGPSPPEPSGLPAPEAAAPARLPAGTNVLLIVEDTLRGDHLSLAGYPRATSPTLDRLARSGVTMARTIAQATRTSPNTASLLTGLRSFSHGIVAARSVLDPELLTLGEMFRAGGYRTMAVVANPNVGDGFQFTQGFDQVVELFEEPGNDAAAVYAEAVALLEEPGDGPFLMWLHPIDPHTPYDPPAPFDRQFYGDELHAERADRHLPFTTGDRTGIRPDARVGDITSWGDYIARYDGEIRYADARLEELVADLERLGLMGDTLIVFTSDHGESLGEHDYFFSHGSYSYEPTAHVPLILHHPLLPAGLVIDELVRTIDILPTIAELLGIPVSPVTEGRSFLPLLDGLPDGEPRIASINSGLPGYVTLAAREERYKLIWVPRVMGSVDRLVEWKLSLWPTWHASNPYRQRSYRTELYDLETDPGEQDNLAGRGLDAEDSLGSQVVAWIDGAAHSFAAVRPDLEELDPAVLERLEALGYVQ